MLFEDEIERELAELRKRRDDEETLGAVAVAADGEGAAVDGLGAELRERMVEVKRRDRLHVASELLYLVVCSRFASLSVPLVRPMREGGAVDLGETDLRPLTEGVHSPQALDAVEAHLAGSFGPASGGGSMPTDRANRPMRVSLFSAGQAYAMSSLYGYVLRRAEGRLQLESRLSGGASGGDDLEPGRLQRYIDKAGPGWFQDEMSTVEAQEALQAQVEALFGSLRRLNDELIDAVQRHGAATSAALQTVVETGEVAFLQLSVRQFRRLLLEAVAFGSLLHEAEAEIQRGYELSPATSSRLGEFGVPTDDQGRPLVPE